LGYAKLTGEGIESTKSVDVLAATGFVLRQLLNDVIDRRGICRSCGGSSLRTLGLSRSDLAACWSRATNDLLNGICGY
jgi:hypothetical protein